MKLEWKKTISGKFRLRLVAGPLAVMEALIEKIGSRWQAEIGQAGNDWTMWEGQFPNLEVAQKTTELLLVEILQETHDSLSRFLNCTKNIGEVLEESASERVKMPILVPGNDNEEG